jgi:hypothetical protein
MVRMSSIKDVPENVKTHLLPDEKVIGRFSSIFREYYATDKRLIGFQRPDWVQVLLIPGILPGVLVIILTRKAYMGACEYSKISGVNRVLQGQVILGLSSASPWLLEGSIVLATFEDPGAGFVLLIMGVFTFTTLWLGRPSSSRLGIAGLPKAEEREWFFSKSKGLKRKNSADEFAELIMTRIKL